MKDAVFFDLETKSLVDLPRRGSFVYADDPSTDILCFGYAFNDEPAEIWIPYKEEFPKRLADHIRAGGIMSGWNVRLFDSLVWNAWVDRNSPRSLPHITQDQLRDTMEGARLAHIPGGLGNAGKFMLRDNRASIKNPAGHRLLKLLCIPTSRDPELWADHTEQDVQDLYDYCKQDVEAERALAEMIPAMDDIERDVALLHYKMNRRGVRVDLKLAKRAVALAAKEKLSLDARMEHITGGRVGACTQVKAISTYLSERYNLELKSLNKDYLRDNLPEDISDGAREVLALRSQAAKSSVSKFRAMLQRVTDDGRLKAMFLYSGAGATGRTSSIAVQLQNLPRKTIKHPEIAFNVMELGDEQDIKNMYGEDEGIYSVLSKCVRSALIPADGCKFAILDYSAIEARKLAWLAGDEKTLNIFRSGRDVYKATYAGMYDVEYEDVDDDQRFVGKVCLHPDTKVVTSTGVKKLIDVKIEDNLWDGIQWIKHQGIIYQGMKRCETSRGITATPDHEILVGNTWVAWSQAHSQNNVFQQALSSANLPLSGITDIEIKKAAKTGVGGRLLNALVALKTSYMPLPCGGGDLLGVMNVPNSKLIQKGGGNIGRSCQMMLTDVDFLTAYPQPVAGATTKTTLNTLITGVVALLSAKNGKKISSPFLNMCRPLKAGMMQRLKWIGSTLTGVMKPGIYASCHEATMPLTGGKSPRCRNVSTSLSPVYDIADAGPLRRFTILSDEGPIVVHNCTLALGYQGGKFALATMARAYGVEYNEAEAEKIKNDWRDDHPEIVQYWAMLEVAIHKAISNPGKKIRVGGEDSTLPPVRYGCDGTHLYCELPSGRRLTYPFVERHSEEGDFGVRYPVTYAKAAWLPKSGEKDWPRATLYGGLAAENITQASSRDLLMYASVKIEDAGIPIVLTVHDELCCEVAEDSAKEALERMRVILETVPSWAEGMPLKAEGSIMNRYGK